MKRLPATLAAILGLWAGAMGAVTEGAAGPPGAAEEVAAARALWEAGKVREATTALEAVVARNPGNLVAQSLLVLGALATNDWEKALPHAEVCVKAKPDDARFQYLWGSANGLAAMKAGVWSKVGYARACLAAHRRAVELEPANINYRWALMMFYRQAPGVVGGDMKLAHAEAAAIRKLDVSRGREASVQLYLKEKKFAEAFRECDEALRESPDDAFALYRFGRVALDAGQRLDEGLAAFRRCRELQPGAGGARLAPAELHLRIGNVLEKKKDFAGARAEYGEALKAQVDFKPARQALARLDAAGASKTGPGP